MNKFVLCFIFICASVFCVFGQDSPAVCPPDTVCLTREQAVEYLTYRDENEALKKEIEILRQAVTDQRSVTETLKIELARVSGEKSQLEADRVRWTAVIDVLIKNSRAKKNGLINF